MLAGTFHSDPGILGKNLTLSEHSFQVIGVVPAQATDWGPPGADFYLPANMRAIRINPITALRE